MVWLFVCECVKCGMYDAGSSTNKVSCEKKSHEKRRKSFLIWWTMNNNGANVKVNRNWGLCSQQPHCFCRFHNEKQSCWGQALLVCRFHLFWKSVSFSSHVHGGLCQSKTNYIILWLCSFRANKNQPQMTSNTLRANWSIHVVNTLQHLMTAKPIFLLLSLLYSRKLNVN